MATKQYRVTPLLFGEAYAVVRCVVRTLSMIRADSRRSAPLVRQAQRALRVIVREPLPAEVAKGVAAHLAMLGRTAQDERLQQSLATASEAVLVRAKEELVGSPFI